MTNDLETRFLRQVNQTWVAKELTRGYDGPINRMHLNKLLKNPKHELVIMFAFHKHEKNDNMNE
jgi:hypothetical protein